MSLWQIFVFVFSYLNRILFKILKSNSVLSFWETQPSCVLKCIRGNVFQPKPALVLLIRVNGHLLQITESAWHHADVLQTKLSRQSRKITAKQLQVAKVTSSNLLPRQVCNQWKVYAAMSMTAAHFLCEKQYFHSNVCLVTRRLRCGGWKHLSAKKKETLSTCLCRGKINVTADNGDLREGMFLVGS